jgi:hypothetical protein
MRHMPNRRMKPRGRPHGRSTHTTGHRDFARDENFGLRAALAI